MQGTLVGCAARAGALEGPLRAPDRLTPSDAWCGLGWMSLAGSFPAVERMKIDGNGAITFRTKDAQNVEFTTNYLNPSFAMQPNSGQVRPAAPAL